MRKDVVAYLNAALEDGEPAVLAIADPRVIARILAHLGLLEPPRPVPPRQPSWLSADAN